MALKVTVPELRARKATTGRGERLALVTAYDATFARLFDQAGVDAILVGDSLGMVIQGGTSTLGVTVDEVCYHGRAVARGTQRAHLIGDMPFLSYHTGVDQAVANAGRLLKEGGFESVKLEGGKEMADVVQRMVRMGIPVVGHVGLMPQRVHAMGGFKVQGKDEDAAESILEDAMAIAEAGAFMIVVEGVPAPLAARITHAVDVPTVGIGAGLQCDGQILVGYDLLGLNDSLKPRFVKRYEAFFQRGVDAVRSYVGEVRDGAFPGPEHSFGLGPRAPEASPRTAEAALAHVHGADFDLAAAYGPTH
ncbi:MAG: 3-methyl-2-oxobutanoate hydroxymethyltransferase [Deltaproteobacteria bacterium]|nr:3-methyl-2-oxobutanoate hydroxymethyltransferase [Deltaproteobacteria bacterium]